MLRATLAAGILMIGVNAFAADAPKANMLDNPGAEQGKNAEPSVWYQAKIPADGLKLSRDDQQVHGGKYSFYIENSHKYDEQVSNNWAQDLENTPAGKRVRLSGWIKTQDADAVNICLQCWDDSGKKMLAFVSTAVIKGDQDWKQATTRPVSVPQETATVTVRAALTGKGKAWFDDIKVVEDRSQRGSADDKDSSLKPAAPQSSASPVKDLKDVVEGKILRKISVDKDTMVISYIAQGSYPSLNYLAVANNEHGVRGFVSWPKIDPTSESHRYLLAVYSTKTTEAEEPGMVEAHEVLTDWGESLMWDSAPKTSPQASSQTPFSKGDGWKLFDVTNVVKGQKNQAQPRGVMLKFSDETKKAPGGWSGYEVSSREGAEEMRPVLLEME
jgi:hypothetical protein